MQLNIEGDEAYRLASRLAELTGQSLTSAVTATLRRSVATDERARAREAMIRDVSALAAEIRTELDQAGGETPTSDHDWLYDSRTGLPI